MPPTLAIAGDVWRLALVGELASGPVDDGGKDDCSHCYGSFIVSD
jgi:hypothetical protein